MALLATLAIGGVYLPASQLGVVRQLEHQLLDLRFRLRPSRPVSDAVVLVRIDDRSLREIGRWPWSRGSIAELLRRLQAAGARTIALDLLLTEPEAGVVPAAALEALRQALREGPEEAHRADRLLGGLLESARGDATLARQLDASGSVVLPILFDLSADRPVTQPEPPPFVARAAFRVVQERRAAPIFALPLAGALPLVPIAELGRAAASLGHGNVPLDPDGGARFELPVIGYRGDYYPSLSLEVARLQLGIGRDRVRLELGRGIVLGEHFVPTDESMRLPVNYGGAGRFRAVSAAEVMTGQADPATLAGRIVLIGGTAAGVGDSFATAFSPQMPGIERHATVIDGILRQDFLVRREANALLELAVVILAGLLIGWFAGRRGLLAASIACALVLTAIAALNFYAFTGLGLWLNLFLPVAAVAGIYLPVLAYSYFVEQRQERRIRAAFKHYLSPALVDQVARNPALLRLGGEQKELTVLFADLRDSTQLGAKLPPAAFAELLNEVMDTVTRVLLAHGGMLDKFTGDGLVAVFGAPLPQPDHALRACRAALAMQDQLAPLQARLSRPDLPPLEIGVGINTGSMIIGNIGSRDRFNYTVVGDEANLGARLEAANKDFRTRILISEATWQRVESDLAARELDEVTFRGMDRPVRVFELLGAQPLPGQAAAQAELFAAALAAYRSGRWGAAAAQFRQLLATTPADRPSQLYLERCRQHLARAGVGHAVQDS
ncbi:MAG TPA: adenylate/guanylate cyclase domain-containing protein [Geminicoccaceae bacterium]|nr:adenylate/guanylate cyclase domain-containing protein [Geminicoccaceae bacterium]